ncbi:hypothetical protein AUR04nite_12640 [Glutamicibacter uratoxydans]|uniref:Alpha/beta hydrolase n=1 Tax=Glutamicibacter uratoxydans TaxID=43667 RepID=A0A4Y4DKA3_GLUUR|nr:hypothetical protein [Glutamicibacter uratoxydans]GED05732.1 hypothetical protein AUR04nite_12640 [Glutamicibacter uratoxydans]
MKTILDGNSKYKIIFTAPESPNPEYAGKILVGFGEIGSGIDSAGFGSALAEKLGIAYVTVNQAKRTQYQYLTREKIQSVLEPLQENNKFYFYGTSLGGYAAAYYSRPLGANFLALSPRLPVHPITDKRIPIRFRSEGYLHDAMNAGQMPSNSSRKVVLFDPKNSVDSFFVRTELAAAYPDLELHHVKNAGHYVPRVLLLSGSLKKVVVDFLSDNDLEITLKESEIIEWHRSRFYLNLEKKRFGHASEHLEVLLENDSQEQIDEYTKSLNSAIHEK